MPDLSKETTKAVKLNHVYIWSQVTSLRCGCFLESCQMYHFDAGAGVCRSAAYLTCITVCRSWLGYCTINHWTACAAALCTPCEVSDVVHCMPIITMESLIFGCKPVGLQPPPPVLPRVLVLFRAPAGRSQRPKGAKGPEGPSCVRKKVLRASASNFFGNHAYTHQHFKRSDCIVKLRTVNLSSGGVTLI